MPTSHKPAPQNADDNLDDFGRDLRTGKTDEEQHRSSNSRSAQPRRQPERIGKTVTADTPQPAHHVPSAAADVQSAAPASSTSPELFVAVAISAAAADFPAPKPHSPL